MDQNKLIMNQLQVARLSMRVIMNNLNEAIFLRTEDGKLSYCNYLGVKIVQTVCTGLFDNDQQ